MQRTGKGQPTHELHMHIFLYVSGVSERKICFACGTSRGTAGSYILTWVHGWETQLLVSLSGPRGQAGHYDRSTRVASVSIRMFYILHVHESGLWAQQGRLKYDGAQPLSRPSCHQVSHIISVILLRRTYQVLQYDTSTRRCIQQLMSGIRSVLVLLFWSGSVFSVPGWCPAPINFEIIPPFTGSECSVWCIRSLNPTIERACIPRLDSFVKTPTCMGGLKAVPTYIHVIIRESAWRSPIFFPHLRKKITKHYCMGCCRLRAKFMEHQLARE